MSATHGPPSARLAAALALGATLAGARSAGADEPVPDAGADAGDAPRTDGARLVLQERTGATFALPPVASDVDGGLDAGPPGRPVLGRPPPGRVYVLLDDEPLDDTKRAAPFAVRPGEHVLRTFDDCGHEQEHRLTVREGDVVEVELDTREMCDAARPIAIYGAPPDDFARPGGCCGGTRAEVAARDPGPLAGAGAVALALARRRRRARPPRG